MPHLPTVETPLTQRSNTFIFDLSFLRTEEYLASLCERLILSLRSLGKMSPRPFFWKPKPKLPFQVEKVLDNKFSVFLGGAVAEWS